jgi:hypothetical protein
MTLQGEIVLVGAGHVEALSDVLRGFAHRVRPVQLLHAGVDEPPPDRRVVHGWSPAGKRAIRLRHRERRARHRLHAAGQHQVGLAELDLAGGLVDRLEARRAQPVDGHARHLDGQPCEQ